MPRSPVQVRPSPLSGLAPQQPLALGGLGVRGGRLRGGRLGDDVPLGAVVDDAGVTIAAEAAEDGLHGRAGHDGLGAGVDDLAGDDGAFDGLDEGDDVGHLQLVAGGGLVDARPLQDGAAAGQVDARHLADAGAAAGGADLARREVHGGADAALRGLQVVALGNLAPEAGDAHADTTRLVADDADVPDAL